MASVNKVIIVGHLGRDPEVRYLSNGDAITSISVATTDSWKDKATGDKKEQTEWHRISAFGKLAEIMGQYLKKGSQVYIEGSLRTRKYTDRDGIERYSTDIRADTMQMLGSRQYAGGNGGSGDDAEDLERDYQRGAAPRQGQLPVDRRQQQGRQQANWDMDDDIPFDQPYRGRRALAI